MTSAVTLVTTIVREHLTPLIAARGFTGTGTTFRRRVSEGEQVVNIQRGSRNRPAEARFHLNGGVYLAALDAAIGRPHIESPDEPSCHVRLRPDHVVASGQDTYVVTPETDAAAMGSAVARDLDALLDELDRLATPDAAVAHLSERWLAQYEHVFGWYLSRGDIDRARTFAATLHERFGEERRWAIFADKLDAVARQVGAGADWRGAPDW